MIGQNQNKQDVVLESYGMIGVWLSDFNGNSLNLKPGEKCKMTTKIPETMRNYAPSLMPLWHFDESAGIWMKKAQPREMVIIMLVKFHILVIGIVTIHGHWYTSKAN